MSTLRRCLLAATLAIAPAAPAWASTLPPVDFKSGQWALAGGVGLPLDLSVDYALSDRVSVGASYIPMQGFGNLGAPMVSAARATFRLGETPTGLVYGVTLSGGTSANVWGNLPAGAIPTHSIWLQPALNVAWPLGPVTLRGTVGPLLFSSANYMPAPGVFSIWPNVELAFRVFPGQELTLGGNSLVGWRATF